MSSGLALFETTNTYDLNIVIDIDGKIRKRKRLRSYTDEGIRELAQSLGAIEENGVFVVYGGNDARLFFTTDADYRVGCKDGWATSEFFVGEVRVLGIGKDGLKLRLNDFTMDSLVLSEDFDTSNMTHMNRLFYKSHPSKIVVESIDTSHIQSMKEMFLYAATFDLHLGEFDTSNVKDMTGMFKYCKTTELDLSNFKFKDDVIIKEMFDHSGANIIVLTSMKGENIVDQIREPRNRVFNECEAKIVIDDAEVRQAIEEVYPFLSIISTREWKSVRHTLHKNWRVI